MVVTVVWHTHTTTVWLLKNYSQRILMLLLDLTYSRTMLSVDRCKHSKSGYVADNTFDLQFGKFWVVVAKVPYYGGISTKDSVSLQRHYNIKYASTMFSK